MEARTAAMKTVKRVETALLLLLLGWIGPSASAAEGTKLRFDIYSGYVVSNQFEPNAAESFLLITDQQHFDKTFGVATTTGGKPHLLPKDTFKSNMVLAAVKRGKTLWEFKVDEVTESKGVVEIRYTATKVKTESATVASLLIVSIAKGKYGEVQFVENGKTTKKVELGK
jgi:hypothetical protein